MKVMCTIIAKNYLAFARVLCRSFLANHNDGKCFVLFIDDIEGYIEAEKENFECLSLDVIDIPEKSNFCFQYNITELSTAVKPFLLEYLFSKYAFEKILYLDPDILVTAPLNKLYDRLESEDVLLTPHLDADYPDDGMLPNDSHIMRSGIFNLGFIGLRNTKTVGNFLRWWKNKLYEKCVIDHAVGYFVDQKFVEYAFPLFKIFNVIYEPQYNVAYWNIHSRKITRENETWLCNGVPLCFFHFSNYKPDQPDTISGHQNRFRLNDYEDLKALFLEYNKLLLDNGYNISSKWPYEFNKAIDNRNKITKVYHKYKNKSYSRRAIRILGKIRKKLLS